MKVCIVTTGAAAAEPRAMKQAMALKARWPHLSVSLCDAVPLGEPAPDPAGLAQASIVRRRVEIPTRRRGAPDLAVRKVAVALARAKFRHSGTLTQALFGVRAFSLAARLRAEAADVYVAHGIDALLPSSVAARALGARLVFDSMEYYADMGDQQSLLDRRAVGALQSSLFPVCDLVLAASDEIADRLSQEYPIERPTPLYNTPAIEADLPARNAEFSLYWRNYQIGFGQRGLDDALVALSQVPGEIKLYLQGRPPHDGGSALAARLSELGIAGRVIVKAPFAAGGAVREAAAHSVGLCLERSGPLNHELTVSNKMFDYLMAGLVAIASDLPGLRTIVERSGGGLLYTPGSPDSLAAAIRRLHADRGLLSTLSGKARAYALEVGNEEVDMKVFTDAMSRILRLDDG
jgi:glycosyltransferase involved in cell wall biosynthesis